MIPIILARVVLIAAGGGAAAAADGISKIIKAKDIVEEAKRRYNRKQEEKQCRIEISISNSNLKTSGP